MKLMHNIACGQIAWQLPSSGNGIQYFKHQDMLMCRRRKKNIFKIYLIYTLNLFKLHSNCIDINLEH